MTNLTRKEFIKKSSLGVAAATLTMQNVLGSTKNIEMNNLTLKNVRLETGFVYEENEVVATKTDLFTLEISEGKIKSIRANESQNSTAVDAKGYLMLPNFKDMHIHLDKTVYSDHWQAVRRRKDGIKGMIALEQKIMPELLKNSTQKAEKMIELLQSQGSSFARSHVNIEPTSKLQSLKNLQKALDNKKESFGAELVAFPQHGLFYTNSALYMKEAAQSGIDFIGGVDPFTIDGAIEKTIDYTVQLALDYNKGIDIHLHESGESGNKTIAYLIQKVNENPVLKGKTALSHCFSLAKLSPTEQEKIAVELAEAQIGIMSTVPFGGLIMPIPTLLKHGVKVMAGNDSIVDHWGTFGTGSVLQKANLAAQLYGQVTEFGLTRMLQLATGGVVPLNENGKQIWPKTNDAADFVLLDASCSAEAVSRISPVKSLYFKGKKVY